MYNMLEVVMDAGVALDTSSTAMDVFCLKIHKQDICK